MWRFPLVCVLAMVKKMHLDYWPISSLQHITYLLSTISFYKFWSLCRLSYFLLLFTGQTVPSIAGDNRSEFGIELIKLSFTIFNVCDRRRCWHQILVRAMIGSNRLDEDNWFSCIFHYNLTCPSHLGLKIIEGEASASFVT